MTWQVMDRSGAAPHTGRTDQRKLPRKMLAFRLLLLTLLATVLAYTAVVVSTQGWAFGPVFLADLAAMNTATLSARATDDLMVMVIECTAKTNEGEVSGFLNSIGATEVNTQVAEDGWWLGTYDKDKKLFAEKQ